MKHGIFEKRATSFRFSKILASFERSPLSFFHSFFLIINVIFVFFFDIKTKKKFGSTKGVARHFISVTRYLRYEACTFSNEL